MSDTELRAELAAAQERCRLLEAALHALTVEPGPDGHRVWPEDGEGNLISSTCPLCHGSGEVPMFSKAAAK